MKELALSTSAVNEQIDALRDRLGDVNSEKAQLTIELAKLGYDDTSFDLEGDSKMHKLVRCGRSAALVPARPVPRAAPARAWTSALEAAAVLPAPPATATPRPRSTRRS